MPGPFRQTDAVLTIAQDNAKHSIEVSAANEVAGELIGIPPEQLRGMPFKDIVPQKIAEMLDDYVEYIPGANDVGDVLRKVRDFHIRARNGKEMPMRLKIVRHHSQSLDEYLLIMNDEERERESNAALAALHEAFQGHASLDADTGLPDRDTLLKGLELVELHRESIRNGVCVAVMELDKYETILGKYGIQACHRAVHAIAQHCQQNLRGNDVIAQVGDRRLALLLIGASREPAKIVLNRLRWLVAGMQIRTDNGLDVTSTVTVAFNELGEDVKAVEMFERLETALNDKPKDSTNLVVEA